MYNNDTHVHVHQQHTCTCKSEAPKLVPFSGTIYEAIMAVHKVVSIRQVSLM